MWSVKLRLAGLVPVLLQRGVMPLAEVSLFPQPILQRCVCVE